MTVVVDTSVLVDHLRGDGRAQVALTGAVERGETLTSSVLTKVEVLAGMRTGEEPVTRRLLDSLVWAEVDDAIAERAGGLASHYLRSHPGIDPVDYVIAATVEHLDGELLTRNVKHFPMFPDLAPPY